MPAESAGPVEAVQEQQQQPPPPPPPVAQQMQQQHEQQQQQQQQQQLAGASPAEIQALSDQVSGAGTEALRKQDVAGGRPCTLFHMKGICCSRCR